MYELVLEGTKRKGADAKKIGGPEYRSRRLSHAKRALYHMS